MSRIAILALLAALSAPAAASGLQAPASSLPSTPATLSTLRQADARVAAVAYRLALAGRAHCPAPFPLTGMLLHHLAEYEPADRSLMIARYGLDRGPGVLSVLAGSPAARAGLAAGDVLLAVGDMPFPSPALIAAEPNRRKWRPRVEATEAQLEAALRRGAAGLSVLREGAILRLTLDSLPACPGRVRLARSRQTNAFAVRGYVVMTTALLDFLRGEEELAVVLGHELSHNILGHQDLRDDEGLIEGLGIRPSGMWRREEAADRLGLRLMAAAAYAPETAIPFWRRYLKRFDWFPQIFRSHPSLKARERIAQEEIAAMAREAALTP